MSVATGVRRQSRWTRWSAVLAVALLLPALVACGDSGTEGGQGGADTTPTSAAEQTVLSPELEAELAALIAAEIDVWMTVSGVPGMSLAVVGPGGLELTEVAGVSDLTTQTPVTPEDFWRFGSVTKPFTSAVIYHLADEGLVNLDAPVADYLGSGWAEGYQFNGVDVGDTLTVKQMLNYTSGFPEYATSPLFFAEALTRLDVPIEPEEIVAWAVAQEPVAEPGTEPNVTTAGHIVAGLIIEQVTGRQAHEVMRELVFEPSGSPDLFLPPGEVPPEPVVTAYVSSTFAEALRAIWPSGTSLGEYEDVRARALRQGPSGELFDLMSVPQDLLESVGWTGGGLDARPIDVARAFRATLDGTVIPAATVDAMATTVPSGTYAQGIVVAELDGDRAYTQSGVVPGFNSGAVYLPDWGIAVAASSNTESPGLPVRNLVDAVALIVRTIYIKAETDAAGG